MYIRTLLAGATAIAAVLTAPAVAQELPKPGSDNRIELVNLAGPDTPYIDEVSLPAGKSMVLRFDMPISEASVGNPEFADIVPLTDRSIYILGKSNGSTNVTIFGPRKQVLGIIDVNVAYDTVALKKRLYESLPGEDISVHVNGETVMLSGKVSSSAVAARASELAESFAPGAVLNTLELGSPQQVMLAVRFAEVERSAAKALGISTDALFDDTPNQAFGFIDQLNSNFTIPQDLGTSSFAVAHDFIEIGDVTIDLMLDALEQKGVASVLAEPTLMAISGEPASFLAGGEFPIPVSSTSDADGNARITIEFKEFGVRLAFTPTVIGDKVSLVVSPEVSELDAQNGIQMDGIVIPGLKSRKATTTVELKNGQSFSIAGLIQKDFLDDLAQLPGIGNVPVIGALNRSARYQRSETELAIIITPYIVTPDTTNSMKLPTDYFTHPHEFELFFLGRMEAGTSSGFGSIIPGVGASSVTSSNVPGTGAAVGYALE